MFPATKEEDMQRARGYTLHVLGVCLFLNTNMDKVALKNLHFLEDLKIIVQYSKGFAILSFLYIYFGLC